MMHPQNPSMLIELVLWDRSGQTACTLIPSPCTAHGLIPRPSHLQYMIRSCRFFTASNQTLEVEWPGNKVTNGELI